MRVIKIVAAAALLGEFLDYLEQSDVFEDVAGANGQSMHLLSEAGAERVCVGLGVSNAEHVAEIAAYADGVIVGTALVAAIRDGGADAVASLTRDLSAGLTRK